MRSPFESAAAWFWWEPGRTQTAKRRYRQTEEDVVCRKSFSWEKKLFPYIYAKNRKNLSHFFFLTKKKVVSKIGLFRKNIATDLI